MKCLSARVGGVAFLLANNKHGTLRSCQRQPSSWFRRDMDVPTLKCLARRSTLTTTSRTTRLYHNAGSRDSPSIPPAKISLRNATLDDLETLQKWDEQDSLSDENVMGGADWNDWNWEYELPRQVHWRFQLVAEVSTADETTEPIGFVQVIDPVLEETHYWGEYLDDHNRHPSKHCRAIDIWIGEEAFLGKGYGTQMMKLVLRDYCFGIDSSVQSVLVDPMSANTAAHRFYQRLGFKPERLYNFGPDECLVHRLCRDEFGV